MSNRSTGRLHESLVRAHLESQGYLVEGGHTSWIGNGSNRHPIDRDILGLFDILAVRGPDTIRLIQITAGGPRDVERRRQKIFGSGLRIGEVWHHLGGQEYRIYLPDESSRVEKTEGQGETMENSEHVVYEFKKNSKEVVRVISKKFKGLDLYDFRIYYDDGTGTMMPGKGLAIRQEQLSELKLGISKLEGLGVVQ